MIKKIYEITGLPCSGKSYFCNDIDGFLNKKKLSIVKAIFFEIKLLLLGIFFLKTSTLYAFLILCLHEKAPLTYRLKIFRNIIKKFGVYKKFRYVVTGGYVDEGISHIPFNLLHSNTAEVINILRPYLSLINVKYIKVNSNTCLRERLTERGHERLVFLDVDEFIHLNRNVEITLLAIYPDFCLTFEVMENV